MFSFTKNNTFVNFVFCIQYIVYNHILFTNKPIIKSIRQIIKLHLKIIKPIIRNFELRIG